jgi:hypothetical protein
MQSNKELGDGLCNWTAGAEILLEELRKMQKTRIAQNFFIFEGGTAPFGV